MQIVQKCSIINLKFKDSCMQLVTYKNNNTIVMIIKVFSFILNSMFIELVVCLIIIMDNLSLVKTVEKRIFSVTEVQCSRYPG